MASLASLLQKTELFPDVPLNIVQREIIPHGHLQEYEKGQFLITPQQKVDQFGIVLAGKVHTLHIFADGSESLMNSAAVGEFTGVDLVCTRSQISPYYAVAATNSRLFFLPIHIFTYQAFLSEEVRFGVLEKLLTLISNENMKKEYRLAILSQKGLRERIVTFLTMQANRLQKRTFLISFSREEMASYLCVNRSVLSHELSMMQQEGLISFHKNEFALHGWDLDF